MITIKMLFKSVPSSNIIKHGFLYFELDLLTLAVIIIHALRVPAESTIQKI